MENIATQSAPAAERPNLLEESFVALQSESCPTALDMLILKIEAALAIGVDGNEVLVWQGRLLELKARRAEIGSPWNEHLKCCETCKKAGRVFGK